MSVKRKMTDLAYVFLALPGGVGQPLHELFEAWSCNALGYHKKPFCLLNFDGFWDGMDRVHRPCTPSGFLSAQRRSQPLVASTPEQALELLTTPLQPLRGHSGKNLLRLGGGAPMN